MKKEIIICIISIMLVCACVPTPTEEFVVNRSDNVAQQIIEASPVPEISEQGHFVPISFPEEWNDMIETPHLSIPIKAEVITSGQSIYPVRTVQKKRFTASDVAPIANILLSDRKAYHLGAQYTRSDYEDAIRSALDHGLEDAASELNDMLEDVKLTEEDFQLMPDDFFSNTFVGGGDVMLLLENGQKANLSFSSNKIVINRHAGALLHDRSLIELFGSYDEDTTRSIVPSISLQSATEKADELLNALGMSEYRLCEHEECRYFDGLGYEEWSTGWHLKYVRSYEYYPVNISELDGGENGFFQFEPQETFNQGWNNELIDIYVSENGIETLYWDNPLEITGIANENVELMNFEELERIMKNMFIAGLSWMEYDAGYAMKLNKVILTTSIQPQKDRPNEAYLMPTWVCIMDLYLWDYNKNEPGRYDGSFAYGFNAIDGTRVSMSGTY